MEIDADGWPVVIPQSLPEDTVDCIFLGRAVEQIGEASVERDRAIAQAIEVGKLKIRARLNSGEGDPGGDLGVVSKTALTPEGWIAAVKVCQIAFKDRRPWVSVRGRRAIPQPHWLFVTRASLDEFMKGQPTAKGRAEVRAIKHLACLLKSNPNMRKEDARAACAEFNLSDRGFEDRVWPKAREEAGLPPIGKSGRKRTLSPLGKSRS
jgi:hypothetical protein